MKVPSINPVVYHSVVTKLLNFATANRFLFSYPTPGGILDACENPESIVTKTVAGIKIPDEQTGQMGLEHLFFDYYFLIEQKLIEGFCCLTQSVRDEKEPEERHFHMFPMFEMEMAGDKERLYEVVSQLLKEFGFNTPVRIKYEDACTELGVEIIGSKEEHELYLRYGNCIALEDFPERSAPFFNMKREKGVAKKIDFLLFGEEVIGSAERSTDEQEMLSYFFSSNNGRFAGALVSLFGLVPVISSLFSFLKKVERKHVRSGFGMGIVRFINALIKLENEKNTSISEPNL